MAAFGSGGRMHMHHVRFAGLDLSPATGDNQVAEAAGSRDRICLLTHARADARFATEGSVGPAYRARGLAECPR